MTGFSPGWYRADQLGRQGGRCGAAVLQSRGVYGVGQSSGPIRLTDATDAEGAIFFPDKE